MAVTYKDYYQILGVPKTADAKAIKSAYRKLARKYHPDQNPGNKAAAERFKEINEANEVLSDPEKRQRYDTLGPDWARYAEAGAGRVRRPAGAVRAGRLPGPRRPVGRPRRLLRVLPHDLRRPRRAPGRPFQGVEFEDRGPFRSGGARARRGGDLETEVEISLEEA